MRLFVAVVPPEAAVADLDRLLEPRRAAGRADGLRWSPPEQWHLTLAFAAEAAEHRVDDLAERLAAAAARRDAFVLRLAGGGAFPDPARATVLWVGLDRSRAQPTPAAVELDRLAVGVRNAVATAGTNVDGTRFRPHLTLARRTRPGEVSRWVRLLDDYAGPSFTVGAVTLFASHLGEGPRGRPRHEPLATFPLGPPR